MATAPYTVNGTLDFPPDVGAPNLPIVFSGSGQFRSRPADILNLVGAGTQSVSFGTVPAAGAKIILVEVDPDATNTKTPVFVKINGSATGKIEVAPGGCMLIHNPKPVAGVASMDIEFSSDNTVRFWLMGD